MAAYSTTSQVVTLPSVPELFKPDFLDVLLPPLASKHAPVEKKAQTKPTNLMMSALAATSYRTRTANNAPAYSSTLSPTLDAFNGITSYTAPAQIEAYLDEAWKGDPDRTLKIIWNIRSIHDGKGDRETFYRAFGWLYENHPRTAIANLHLLVDPVCSTRKGKNGKANRSRKDAELLAHGYWKDLLNILALATLDQLTGSASNEPAFLHASRGRHARLRRKRFARMYWTRRETASEEKSTPEARIAEALRRDQAFRVTAEQGRRDMAEQRHAAVVRKLEQDCKYRALYVAVARLFAERLGEDLKIVEEVRRLDEEAEADGGAQVRKRRRAELLKKVSLAGKWAPTPHGSHDRVTNISTAIALVMWVSQITPSSDWTWPTSLPAPLLAALPAAHTHTLRSFLQRWVLTPLRAASLVPEPLMCTNRWSAIDYARVSSKCMKLNGELFFKHDTARFAAYVEDVEQGTMAISGATLWPHELVAEVVNHGGLRDAYGYLKSKKAAPDLDSIKLRLAEAQWLSLVERLKASGSLKSALAVCDVSGSMGSLTSASREISTRKGSLSRPAPILPAIALSLVLAFLAEPPFNGGFITFSADPQFVRLEILSPDEDVQDGEGGERGKHQPRTRLSKLIGDMVTADWGANTNLVAVFTRLLIPLARAANVQKEDMIKRLFIFSDMQFDEACVPLVQNQKYHNHRGHVQADWQAKVRSDWQTNYDVIKSACENAGYDVPEIIFWNLNATTGTATVEGQVKNPFRTGVGEAEEGMQGIAMLSGFSPALLKVFLGENVEEQEDEADEEWVDVDKQVKEKKEKKTIDPVSVMLRIVGKKSFDGLVVLD